MTTSPLGLRLAALELLQNDGFALTAYDRGTLAAAKRFGDPEIVARAETIERLEAARAGRKRRAQR